MAASRQAVIHVEIIYHLIGLGHLCEFIEDCEFTTLLTKVLYLLGEQGPKAQNPNKYIRFIYNRIILESATVRASAISALAKYALAEWDHLISHWLEQVWNARPRAARQCQGAASSVRLFHTTSFQALNTLQFCARW